MHPSSKYLLAYTDIYSDTLNLALQEPFNIFIFPL